MDNRKIIKVSLVLISVYLCGCFSSGGADGDNTALVRNKDSKGEYGVAISGEMYGVGTRSTRSY